jgi:hypothetical protein
MRRGGGVKGGEKSRGGLTVSRARRGNEELEVGEEVKLMQH